MNKFKFIYFFIFVICVCSTSEAFKIEIKAKVGNHIITNIDLEQEKKYLIFLNPKLIQLDKKKIENIANNSLTTYIIKREELIKYYNIDNENQIIDSIEKKFLSSKKIKSKDEYLKILDEKNLDYEMIRNKLFIEGLWNRYIYKKYFKNVKIDKENLRKNILKINQDIKKKYEYHLSEIMISNDKLESLDDTFSKIYKSIEQFGFENTANIFSISNTSKTGGTIGWVSELQISKNINKNIYNLKINEVSRPIPITNGHLFLKLNDKREFNQKIDIENQLNKIVNKETNRQLNNFSVIFYKKLKKNTEINEF